MAVAALLAAALAGCESSDDGDPESQRVALAWSVLEGLSELYNQHVVGLPAGPVDLTAACPFGGEAHLVGNTVVPGGGAPEQVDLTYELTGCRIAPVSSDGAMRADLSLDGIVAESASLAVDSTTGNYNSESLGMAGTVTNHGTTSDVDEICSYHANVQPQGVQVLICDDDVAW